MSDMQMGSPQVLEIDEYLVKVSAGYVPVANPQGLEMDKDVIVAIQGQIVKIEESTNNDGTIKKIYTIKGEICAVNGEEVD